MMLVTVRVSIPRGRVHDNARVEVFVEASDSLQEVRNRAITKMRQFYQDVLDAPAVEMPPRLR